MCRTGQDMRQQHPVVRPATLGAYHRDAHVGVTRSQLLHQARAGHPVAHDDHVHDARSRRTAQTLNSGMRDVGSSASLVTRLAHPDPPQWNGSNTVSARIVSVMRTGPTASPRRLTTRITSPS